MKRILFGLLLLIAADVFGQGSITTKCAVCPPKLNGVPDGWCLKDSAGHAVWGPCADAADSVFWHTANGSLYQSNQSLNVGIGTDNPMGKFTVVNDAQSVVFGSLYSNTLGDNAWGTEMTDSCHKYGYVIQNPNAPSDHMMVLYSMDTCNGEGVQLMLNHDALDQKMTIIMNYDNPDTNKSSRITFNPDGFRMLKNTDFSYLFQITPTGQMVYTKGAGSGKILTSDASGNANWQFNSTNGTAPPATTPTYIGQLYVDTSAKKLYFATGTSSSADWTIAN